MTIAEKVAYIQGLFDGMGMDQSQSGEAKILSQVLDVLKEVGEELNILDATLDEHGREFEAVAEARCDLSEDLDELYEDDEESELDGLDDEDFFEVSCPNCGADLVVDDEVLEAGTIDCPDCGQKFALSFDDGEGTEE